MSGDSPAAIARSLVSIASTSAGSIPTDGGASGEAATASAPSPYVSTIAESPRSGFMSAGV